MPSQIEEIRLEEIFLDMNRIYPIPMNVEKEVLNNISQFNRQIKRKMQQGGHIEVFTKCRPIMSQQVEFICKNSALKLIYCPCCKERWFET